jgi:predicted DNA-binding protein
MTLEIEITPQLEARLRRLAERQGRNEAEIALLAVERYVQSEEAPVTGRTAGAQVLSELEADGFLGLWRDRPEDTAALAKELRSNAEARGSGG